MIFHILTLFPDMIKETLSHSIMGRSQEKEQIKINPVNIRDFSKSKHKKVDDYPYGGGPGMVMQPEPIYDAYQSIVADKEKKPRVIFLTPQGKTLNQKMAHELAAEDELILLCGHYEGVDERVIEEIVTDEVSIGDFVLTGGELGAMVLIDAVARLVPGVLGCDESFEDESFSKHLLEYPQYTRPAIYHGVEIPEVLRSGHHKNIDLWRRQQSLARTAKKRPDLFEKAELTKADHQYLRDENLLK